MKLFKIHTEENGKDVNFGVHGVYADSEKDVIKYAETEIVANFLSMGYKVEVGRTSKRSVIYSIIYVWDDEDVKYRRIIIWAIEIENYGKVEEIVKTLKQKPILDKIRAKIEQSYCIPNNDYDQGRNYGLYMATQIIDKYKVESEDER